MPKTKTLLQLRTSVATEGQYENSDDITAAVLTDYINKALIRGREIITGKWADYYTVSTDDLATNISLVGGTASYALPTDFEHLRAVWIRMDALGQDWRRLRPYDLIAESTFQRMGLISKRYRYRMQGGNILFSPTPTTSGDVIKLHYIPYCPELAADGDSVTILVDAEYELYVLLALKKCRRREDLDTADLDLDIKDCIGRLAVTADGRDATEPFYLDARGPGHWSSDGDCED